MNETKAKALAFTLGKEGGLSNNPNDPGAETYKGISRHYWPNWDGWQYVDAGNFDEAEKHVEDFYTVNFWNAMHCDDLPYPFDLIAFDSAVNPGPGATAKFLALSQNWRDVLFMRMQHYREQDQKQHAQFFGGLIDRCLDLWKVASS